MGIEHLACERIIRGKELEIPRGASHYTRKAKTISPKKGREPRVNFFYVNSFASRKMKEIPENARYMKFDIEMNEFHIDYGEAEFYDKRGNLINEENK